MENSKKLIQLSSHDNVLVVCQNISAGSVLEFGSTNYHNKSDISLGHKIAATNIDKGTTIIKFNVSIGSAIADIEEGEHVHVHNIKSDFIPTYTIDEQNELFN